MAVGVIPGSRGYRRTSVRVDGDEGALNRNLSLCLT